MNIDTVAFLKKLDTATKAGGPDRALYLLLDLSKEFFGRYSRPALVP